MLTENIIFAGVQFNRERNYKTSNFDTTNISRFMNIYLIKDLFQNNIKTKEQLLEEIKTLRAQLDEALNKNRNLEQENNNYKKKIKRIQDITAE